MVVEKMFKNVNYSDFFLILQTDSSSASAVDQGFPKQQ